MKRSRFETKRSLLLKPYQKYPFDIMEIFLISDFENTVKVCQSVRPMGFKPYPQVIRVITLQVQEDNFKVGSINV